PLACRAELAELRDLRFNRLPLALLPCCRHSAPHHVALFDELRLVGPPRKPLFDRCQRVFPSARGAERANLRHLRLYFPSFPAAPGCPVLLSSRAGRDRALR